MSSYQQFAEIYEDFMRDAPYDQWMTWLESQFPQLASLRVADVGCGTGTLTRRLAGVAKTVSGVEPSEAMLGIAAQRVLQQRAHVAWFCQGAAELCLPEKQDLIISSCDSLNYLVDAEELRESFVRFGQNLHQGGFLAFDLVGRGRLRHLAEGFSYDLRDDAAILFETRVEDEIHIFYELCAFVETDTGLYNRFEEAHEQRYYPEDQICEWLEDAGFRVVIVTGDFGETALTDAQRILFLAEKQSTF